MTPKKSYTDKLRVSTNFNKAADKALGPRDLVTPRQQVPVPGGGKLAKLR
jgi:hypothetical protein